MPPAPVADDVRNDVDIQNRLCVCPAEYLTRLRQYAGAADGRLAGTTPTPSMSTPNWKFTGGVLSPWAEFL